METKSSNRVLTDMTLSGGLYFRLLEPNDPHTLQTTAIYYGIVYPLVLRSSIVFLIAESIWLVAVPR